MSDAIDVRLATTADAPVLARHRASMFRDMGELQDNQYGAMLAAAENDLAAWLVTGDYVGFVASPRSRPGEIVARRARSVRATRLRANERDALHGGAAGNAVKVMKRTRPPASARCLAGSPGHDYMLCFAVGGNSPFSRR